MARSLAGTLFDEELVATFVRDAEASFAPYFERDPDGLTPRLAADLSEWLPHDLLAKVDRATMAFSLEARVPYLARDVADFVVRLPDEVKIRGGETKVLLRRALSGVVPDEVLERPKQGFDLPLAAWIRGPLRDLAAERLDPRALSRWPGLHGQEVASMFARHLSGAADFGLPLFNILSVSLFLDAWGA